MRLLSRTQNCVATCSQAQFPLVCGCAITLPMEVREEMLATLCSVGEKLAEMLDEGFRWRILRMIF